MMLNLKHFSVLNYFSYSKSFGFDKLVQKEEIYDLKIYLFYGCNYYIAKKYFHSVTILLRLIFDQDEFLLSVTLKFIR